jgi:hypothetical protein
MRANVVKDLARSWNLTVRLDGSAGVDITALRLGLIRFYVCLRFACLLV